MRITPFSAAAALALVLALGMTVRVGSQQAGFRKVVNESLLTTEGYDQQFINLVNQLEVVLTTRASFPFLGGKDPMTGRRREMAAHVLVAKAPPAPPAAKARSQARTPPPAAAGAGAAAAPEREADRIRLTAIIADDYGQHTAIVMDGERSMSVDVGDSVGDRKVVRITGRELTMEDNATVFTYGLAGTMNRRRK